MSDESGFTFWIVIKVIVFAGIVIGLVLPPIARARENMK